MFQSCLPFGVCSKENIGLVFQVDFHMVDGLVHVDILLHVSALFQECQYP